MAIELKVPSVGESITEAMIGEWLKSEGDAVEEDEALVVIETDKVSVELPAPKAGVLKKILKKEGEDAEIGEVIGYLEAEGEEGEGEAEAEPEPEEEEAEEAAEEEPEEPEEAEAEPAEEEAAEGEAEEEQGKKPPKKPAQKTATKKAETKKPAAKKAEGEEEDEPRITPAARRALAEAGLEASEVEATGPGGRLLKEDVLRHTGKLTPEDRGEKDADAGERQDEAEAKEAKEAKETKETKVRPDKDERAPDHVALSGPRQEEVVKMTPLRRRVAERLVEAQQTAALLTTFNEIDMSRVVALRQQYQDAFTKKYGIKLGFMSFFVKAAVEALKEVPQVNAEIRGQELVYRNYQDIGVAVGGGKGLVVPVIRNAERLSFAEVEKTIADLAGRARDNKLKLEELQGGTFTISNGGIYGSLLSTPIVNPPQSGILGLHKIEDRPVAVDGQVVVRPMMYVALTYDHRIVDGREAVTFLVHIKERIEDPTRILLEV